MRQDESLARTVTKFVFDRNPRSERTNVTDDELLTGGFHPEVDERGRLRRVVDDSIAMPLLVEAGIEMPATEVEDDLSISGPQLLMVTGAGLDAVPAAFVSLRAASGARSNEAPQHHTIARQRLASRFVIGRST